MIFKRHSIAWLTITGFAFLIMISCKRTDIQFGSQFVDNENTNIVKVDTFTPVISTVYVDSFVTSSSGIGLTGAYNDPEFGLISARSFNQLQIPTTQDTTITDKCVYDSLVFLAIPNKTYYGDTTKQLDIALERVIQDITPPSPQVVFYNKSSVLTDSLNPLGDTSFYYSPARTDTIKIKLSDVLGQTLYDLIRRRSPLITNQTNFVNWFKGISLRATNSDGIVLGFKDSVRMRLYYEAPGTIRQQRYLDFSFTNSASQFNNIKTDRRQPFKDAFALNDLNQPKYKQVFTTDSVLNTPQTLHKAFLQYITQQMIKIRFPSIQEILKVPGFSRLSSAALIIKPVNGTFDPYYYQLPATLRLSQTDINNQFQGDLTVAGAATTQKGNLIIDYVNTTNTSYSFDLTAYLNQELGDNLMNRIEKGLLLAPPVTDNILKFNRLVMWDNTSPVSQYQTKLLIYYITVQ
jgi:hypothetical protein